MTIAIVVPALRLRDNLLRVLRVDDEDPRDG
jgi:hypothetical protein